MRLDHLAYRVKSRVETAAFLMKTFGYRRQTEFDLEFADGSTTKCIALEPPEKSHEKAPRSLTSLWPGVDYHLAPEIFVSDGSPDSIVGQWVAARDGVGGIHHLAYEVESVQETMDSWKAEGLAEFASEAPLSCPGLVQVFTKPHALTGVVYELIERQGEFGFCQENVKNLMESTKDDA